jgi:hypothetical protein
MKYLNVINILKDFHPMTRFLFLLSLFFLDVLHCAEAMPLLKLKAVFECQASTEPFGYETEIRFYRLDVLNQEILKGADASRTLFIVYDKKNLKIRENGSYSFSQDDLTIKPFVDKSMLRSLSSADEFDILNEYTASIYKKQTTGVFGSLGIQVYTPESYKQFLHAEVVNKADIENLFLNCENNIESDKQQKATYEAMIVIGGIISIVIAFFILKFIIKKVRQSVSDVSKKAGDKLHEYRVQKIAEDEAIRATVKKSMENSNDTSELQELINKAVAKGDTETAQALLSILNNRK